MNALPLDATRISSLKRQCRHHNIFPTFLLNVYFDSEPESVYKELKPLADETSEYLAILSPMEQDAVIGKLPGPWRWLLDSCGLHRDSEYLLRVALYYLASLIQQDYHSLKQIINEDLETSEVLAIYPELRERLDRDGLLLVDNTLKLMDGGIRYRDHVLHYHQFLRRGFTSMPNAAFLSIFALYQRNSGNQFRIAIDHHRIMSAVSYSELIELDTWYGPRFDPADIDNLDKVGVTVINRDRPSFFDLISKIDRTEFSWKSNRKTAVKSFEAEELSSAGNAIESYSINRYVHAERDTRKGMLRHFDGAATVYAETDYPRRLEVSMPREIKPLRKIKLFRIDGEIELDRWIDLMAMFFKGNEMILEYFDPEKIELLWGEEIRRFKEFQERA